MILNSPTISGSLTVTGNIIASGSITLSGSVASASFATSASNATNAISASYANNLTVAGTLTAQTLVVQTITSSVSFITGSTQFGSISANTHQFTGSVNITGSLTVVTTGTELQVNASGVNLGNVSTDTHTITGSILTSGSVMGLGTTITSSEANLFLGAQGTNEGGQLVLQRGTSYTSASHIDNYQNRFRIMSGNDTGSVAERFHIDMTNGYTTILGSVTSQTAQNLVVIRSTTTTNYAELQIENTTNYLQMGVEGATPNRMGGTIAYNAYLGSYANYGMTFHTNNLNRMTITSGGQVLIGSVASLYSNAKLSVKQTAANLTAEIWSNYTNDFGDPALTIVKNDNNTSQVFQRFAINNGNAANGQINGNGASQAAFGTWSDRRLKDNIVELPSQLQNILSLKPCEFDYKNGSGHQIGFIAQEMQEVYSDAVGEDSEGFLTITGWSKTEARLVKAIQELQQQINELKAQ